MRSPVGLGLAVLLVGILAATGVAAQATFNTDVPAGKWTALRLRNLPKGAVVDLTVKTSGDVGVVVTDVNSYRHFPNVSRPLFRGRIVTRVRVSVTAPEAGDYVVVLDNRASQETRQVEVSASARRGPGQPDRGLPERPGTPAEPRRPRPQT